VRRALGGERVFAVPRADYDNPPDSLICLGVALRALREERGLKQIELGAAAGATESQVSDIERAQNNPGWILVVRLLDGLDATVADLADAYSRAQRGELDSGS
jgi:transcriptional regulator with XRE-family HTH domain